MYIITEPLSRFRSEEKKRYFAVTLDLKLAVPLKAFTHNLRDTHEPMWVEEKLTLEGLVKTTSFIFWFHEKKYLGNVWPFQNDRVLCSCVSHVFLVTFFPLFAQRSEFKANFDQKDGEGLKGSILWFANVSSILSSWVKVLTQEKQINAHICLHWATSHCAQIQREYTYAITSNWLSHFQIHTVKELHSYDYDDCTDVGCTQ